MPTTSNATIAPVEVLDATARIENPEVVLAQTDGDAGLVQVRYDVPSRPTDLSVSRLLEAQYADGGWQLTTSLAELPSVANHECVLVPAVAGVALSRPNSLLLYPGNAGRSVSVWLTFGDGGEVKGAVCQGLAGFSDEPVDCSA